MIQKSQLKIVYVRSPRVAAALVDFDYALIIVKSCSSPWEFCSPKMVLPFNNLGS